MTARLRRLPILVLSAAALATVPAGAQSTLDAPPNLSAWVAAPGGLQFNLLHRFSLGPAPSRRLQNAPTLSLAYGLLPWISLGLNYASASEVVLAYPNEWELLVRAALLSQDRGGPMDLYLQGGYNEAASSLDGQLLLARRLGPLRTVAGLGLLEDALRTGRTRATLSAGATMRVHGLIGLAADASTFADRGGSEDVAWSAGLIVGITGTPHTMSLHATNVASRTLQGIARGTGVVRYGFEYTIPISVGRLFSGGGARRGAATRNHGPPAPPPAEAAPAATVVIDLRSLQYTRQQVEVAAGTTVEWRNRDPLAHTVTSDDGSFDSGELRPDASWRHTFTTPGTYPYHCAPHPHMTAVVVVRPHS